MRRFVWPLLAVVLAGTFAIGLLDRPNESASPQQRAEALAQEVRCPTCAGLSVADSATPLAESSREEIDRRIAAGESDAEIKAYFVSRYGKEALLSPPRQGTGSLAWTIPAVGAAALVAASWYALRRWRARPSAETPTADDDEIVRRALEENR